MRRAARVFQKGMVVSAAPRFTARYARSRFCTAGKIEAKQVAAERWMKGILCPFMQTTRLTGEKHPGKNNRSPDWSM